MGRNRAVLLVAAMWLNACVTTTQGGFNVESSEDRALQDYVQLAAGYYAADDLVSAKRHVDNALAIDSRSAEAHNVRALIHQREGEHQLARETFEYAVRLDPSNSRVRNNFAAFLYAREDFQAAYEQLQRVAGDTDYTSRPLAFQNLGLAARAAGYRDEALEAFERALDLDSTLHRAALQLAELHFEDGRFGEARQYYGQFRVNSEFNGVGQTAGSLWLGIRLAWRFDNDGEARDLGRQLQQQFPESEPYRMYLQQRDERR